MAGGRKPKPKRLPGQKGRLKGGAVPAPYHWKGRYKSSAKSEKPSRGKRGAACDAAAALRDAAALGDDDEVDNKPSHEERRNAIKVAIQIRFPNAPKEEWPRIVSVLKDEFKVDRKVVKRVIETVAAGNSPTKVKEGRGRKPRIKPGTEEADRLLGGLTIGLGSRKTARLVNDVVVPKGGKPIHRTTLSRTAKHSFKMKVKARKVLKTGSRDKASD